MELTRIVTTITIFAVMSGWVALAEKADSGTELCTEKVFKEKIPWDQTIERIRHRDPEAAERLCTLREKDPEACRKELTDYMRAHGNPKDEEWGRGPGKDKGPSRWGRGGGPGGENAVERMQRMQRKHEEYLDWLKENYPEEAQELEKVRQENPELYMRRVMHSGRKYGRIAEAAKDNPELAAVLKEDLELKDERDEIIQKLRSAEDGDKEALTAELKEIISKRFDLIVQRKQLQHKQLLEKLEKLKKQIEESETEAAKWEATKDEKVESRLKELIERSEKFRWD